LVLAEENYLSHDFCRSDKFGNHLNFAVLKMIEGLSETADWKAVSYGAHRSIVTSYLNGYGIASEITLNTRIKFATN
jgi:hypothetical protein